MEDKNKDPPDCSSDGGEEAITRHSLFLYCVSNRFGQPFELTLSGSLKAKQTDPFEVVARLHVSFNTCRQHLKRNKGFLHVRLSLALRIIGNKSRDILARQKPASNF